MKSTLALLVLLLAQSAFAQEAPAWIRTDRANAFTGDKYTEFILPGTFVTKPRWRIGGAVGPALLTLNCKEGRQEFGNHYWDGKTISTSVKADIIFAGLTTGNWGTELEVRYKLDGEFQRSMWYMQEDRGTIFEQQAHPLVYKYNVSRKGKVIESLPVHQITLALREHGNNEDVVIRFDVPDSSALVVPCGLVAHEK